MAKSPDSEKPGDSPGKSLSGGIEVSRSDPERFGLNHEGPSWLEQERYCARQLRLNASLLAFLESQKAAEKEHACKLAQKRKKGKFPKKA